METVCRAVGKMATGVTRRHDGEILLVESVRPPPVTFRASASMIPGRSFPRSALASATFGVALLASLALATPAQLIAQGSPRDSVT
jgi:hypothetical protein